MRPPVPDPTVRLARYLAIRGLGGALALAFLLPTAGAQDRLTGVRVASTGVFAESYRFGRGLAQAGGVGAPTAVTSATQWVVPVSVVVPISGRWRADLAAAFTHGQVRHTAVAPDAPEATATLSGVGDVRVRATGRLVGDHVLLTLGANAASGVRELTTEQVTALGVFAAPALGSVLPAASAGPSATTGLVFALQRGGWSWALGGGVEVRGKFAPVAALTAGLPAPNFDPGPAVHLSLGTDGFVGDGALSLAVTADVYTQDRVATGAGPAVSAATVKLGPTIGAELQWRAPTTRFREVTLYVAERYRAPFTRDGARVAGTGASYLNAGLRATYPLGRWTDLTSTLGAWHHTGLSADNTLVTAKTTSGAIGLGLARRVGTYTVEPYVRVRAGTVDTGVGSAAVTGGGAGLTLTARF